MLKAEYKTESNEQRWWLSVITLISEHLAEVHLCIWTEVIEMLLLTFIITILFLLLLYYIIYNIIIIILQTCLLALTYYC